MTLAEHRKRLVDWVGDQAPLSDATPEDWALFKARLDAEIRIHEDHAVNAYVHRDRRQEIEDAAGDAEFEAQRTKGV